MKLLVFAHRLELGGTQINAIDLACHLRDRHGFDIVFHASEGPALELLSARGLKYVPAPDVRLHPSPARIKTLRKLVQQEQPDLIHAWDWWQGLEAYIGVHLPMQVPLVISDMMMSLTRALPREVPTTFGFSQQKDRADGNGWRKTHLLLPPVDVVANAAGAADGVAFRRTYGAQPNEIVLVSVSRLSHFMKADGLRRAIQVIRDLGALLPLKLLIVGVGEARPQLQQLAQDANTHLGRTAVVLTGAMNDPRPAYAAADIVLGMGGSALRGLAFSKPLVVLGEHGFAQIFSSQTVESFQQTGMFGSGDAGSDNHEIENAIRRLAQDPVLRSELGIFGREFVTQHHGLDSVTDGLAQFMHEAITEHTPLTTTIKDLFRTTFFYMRERRYRVASRDLLVGP